MKMVNWMWKGKQKDSGQDKENKKEKSKDEKEPQTLCDFDKDYEGFIDPESQVAQELIKSIRLYEADDDHRHELGHSYGGKVCGDLKQVDKIRSIGKQMIKVIGKKLISGDLNLTRISFPIKAMVPKTALQNSTFGCCTLPYFMKKCIDSNPLQKMKYAMTSIISSAYYMNLFLKPLNPVIGETLQGSYSDGTQIYCQQISHHPPISYFLVLGPNDSYKFYGHYAFEANAGMNSVTLKNKGQRIFEFQDGTKIEATFSPEVYAGVFMGSFRSEAIGGFRLEDKANGITAEIRYGKIKNKPSDYFEGSIIQNDTEVSKFYGSYCGFIQFDGKRYWDGRSLQAFKIRLNQNSLQSDFRRRQDLIKLKNGNLIEAQQQKQKIQQIQRNDVKLRQKHKKSVE